jgi:hypothetical protein
MVNSGFPQTGRYGFEMVDRAGSFCCIRINRIFTPNQIGTIFREFFSILLQCKHLRFIDAC